VGAGRSEIAQAIMGLRETAGGRVLVDGKEVTKRSPQRMQLLGVAHLPEDRDSVGLVTTQPVATNISLAVLDRVSRLGVILFGRERTLARHWVDELQIKARSVDDPVSTLSGGNRQKVVLGKWLALNPGVLILDEPTHGIDVGTKAQVHKIIADLAAEGIAVLVISSDLPEVLGVGDRILVIHEGRLAASFARNEATEEAIMAAATSGRRSAA
ncbi:MAG: ATP-binding cassette domain-containing protein, partial [Fimbriimonadaceae bacterium]|nr:ATP-binding cassette domain-containing protein [Alphaproteobacteria bacterium]